MKTQLTKLRKKLGLSQQELAKYLGKSQSAISHYELGLRAFPVTLALKCISLANRKGVKASLEDVYPRE